MGMGYYKFYRNKLKGFFSTILLVLIVFSSIVRHSNLDEKYVLFGCILCGIIFFLRFFIKPYIEITPNYIKISNFEKLYWKDIEKIEQTDKFKYGKTVGNTITSYNIWPKDSKKYKLRLIQKINMELGYSPFNIGINPLSVEDQKILLKILKERVPNNNINF